MPGLSEKLVDFFLPKACLLCTNPFRPSDLTHCNPTFLKHICKECQEALPATLQYTLLAEKNSGKLCSCCGEPTNFLSTHGDCLLCVLFPPPLTHFRSVFEYSEQNSFTKALRRFKYRAKLSHADLLAELLGYYLQPALATDSSAKSSWDLLVPLPSSNPVLKKRGFSHTGLLARKLGEILNLPVSYSALRSDTPRAKQVSLVQVERFRNTQGAFRAESSEVAERKILLLDDVLTTGASLFSAAETLVKTGAKSVDGFTLFRSGSFVRNRIMYAKHSLPQKRKSIVVQ